MFGILVSLFFGWPAVLGSVVLIVIGLFRSNYRLVIMGAVLAFPFSWVLSGFPVVKSPIFLAPLLPFSAAFALSRGREMIAWLLAIPFFLVVVLLLMLVLPH